MADLIIKPATSGDSIKFQGSDSSAQFTIAGTAGSLDSGMTLSAAAVTGTLGSGVVFPAGHVIQTTLLTPFSLSVGDIASALHTPQDPLGTDGELSIVTKGTSSKFLIHFSGNALHSNPSSSVNKGLSIYVQFCVGAWSSIGTNVLATDAQAAGFYFNAGGWADTTGHVTVVHAPSYTKGDTLRYRQHFSAHSNNTGNAVWNHSGGIMSDTNTTNPYYNGYVMEIAQ